MLAYSYTFYSSATGGHRHSVLLLVTVNAPESTCKPGIQAMDLRMDIGHSRDQQTVVN